MGGRRFVLLCGLVAGVGVAVCLPSLEYGFHGDDYFHQLVLDGATPPEIPTRPWNLYDFGTGEQWEDVARRGDWVPYWWSSPEWRIRFFRPLSSLSLWLDHHLWGDDAVGYHATSLAWYALLLLLLPGLYRAIGLDRPAALLGTALYVATNGAGLPVGWIANRNIVLSTVATAAAVVAVARLRGRCRLPVALLLAAGAAACREAGVVAFLVVAAWLALEALRVGRPPRARALLPAAAAAGAAVAAMALIIALGGGTNCLFYATPWHAPVRYLANLGVLLSSGVLRLMAPVSLDLAILVPGLTIPQAIVSAVVAWPVVVAIGRRLWSEPAARFLALWTALSLLPEGVAPPWDRLLFQASVGSAGLLALYLHGVLGRRWSGVTWRHRALAWLLVASAGALSLINAAAQPWALLQVISTSRDLVLASDPGPRVDGKVDALVLQAVDGSIPFILPATWAKESDREDVRFSALQLGRRGLEWTREGDRTCVFRSTGEPFLEGLYEGVYRTDGSVPPVGSRMEGALFTVEVAEVDGSGVRELRLVFERSVDAPDLRFLAPSGGALRVVAPPEPGETVTLQQPPHDPLLLGVSGRGR